MKIQCDACERQEATVFCSADEAALCPLCDRNVHHANKLATKHLRFSLLPPTSPPLCDICQERGAFLFCKEDRAIMCRECDVPIHSSSEHTQLHSRFLLTGLKLSPSSAVYPINSSSSTSPLSSNIPTVFTRSVVTTTSSLSTSATTSHHAPSYYSTNYNNQYQMGSDQEGSISTTDYYTTSSEVMPIAPPAAWHVDDLLYSSSPPHFFGSQTTEYSGAQQADSEYGYQ